MSKSEKYFLAIFIALAVLCPVAGFASVESTLSAVQGRLIGTILPLVSILGLVFAAFSFVMGSPNARSHLVLALIGAVVGFGAPAIVSFIQSLVH
jgi:nucleoside permease NupC